MNASPVIIRTTSSRPSRGWLHRSAAGVLVACAGLGALSGCGSSSNNSASEATSSTVSALSPDAKQVAHLVPVPGVTFEHFTFPATLDDMTASKEDRSEHLRTVNYAPTNLSHDVGLGVNKPLDASFLNAAVAQQKNASSYRNGTILCAASGDVSTCVSRFQTYSYVTLSATRATPGQAAAYMAELLDAQK